MTKKIYPETFKKCPGLLYFSLLWFYNVDFHSDGLLDTDVRDYFFSHPVEVIGSKFLSFTGACTNK